MRMSSEVETPLDGLDAIGASKDVLPPMIYPQKEPSRKPEPRKEKKKRYTSIPTEPGHQENMIFKAIE